MNGRYSLALAGFPLRGCRAGIMAADGKVHSPAWIVRKQGGTSLTAEAKDSTGEWKLSIAPSRNAAGVGGLRIELSGKPRKGFTPVALIPFSLATLRADHVLVHGRSAGGCEAVTLPAKEAVKLEGWFQHMVTRGGVTLQLCQPLRQRNPTRITCSAKGNALRDLTVSTPVERVDGELRAEPLMLYAARDGHALMTAWADEFRESAKPMATNKAGWNSWDYYRWTITEDEVLKNAEFIAADPVLRRHVKRIIVDDGWQYCYGEWDANSLFPHGMEWLARRLTRMGFEPGLWIAPTIIEPHCRIAQWDTDMLACGVSGLPCVAFECMLRYGFVLDPTQPKVQQWIGDLFARYAAMGYRYFKLDFLQQTLKARRFADPAVPRGDIVRKVVEAARRAVGDRAAIMGCGYPFEAGTAFVDNARVSSDIHALWRCVRENAASIAGRFYSHGRFWINDPDFALCRGPETSNDPDLERLKCCYIGVKPDTTEVTWQKLILSDMTLAEAQVLLSLVAVSGGAVNLSDDLTRLNAVGLDMVRRTVAAERGEGGVPLDLFSSELPAYWKQKLSRGARVLMINWTDREQELRLDLRPLGLDGCALRDFWTDRPVTARDGRLTRKIAPHGCLFAETAQGR